MILMSAKCDNRTPREYFNRPEFKECITLIQDGATIGQMACNGKVFNIPSKMTMPKTQETFEEAKEYFEDKEYRLYICKRFPNRCK